MPEVDVRGSLQQPGPNPIVAPIERPTIRGVPKLVVSLCFLLGVPIIRVIVFCGLYWGPSIWGSCYIAVSNCLFHPLS